MCAYGSVYSPACCRITLQHTEQMSDGRWQMADGCDLYFNAITHYVITQCSVRPFILFWMSYNIHTTLPHTLRESENESAEYHSAWVESARCIPRGHNPSLFIMIDKFIFLILVFIYTITNQFIYQRNAEGGFRFLTIIKI